MSTYRLPSPADLLAKANNNWSSVLNRAKTTMQGDGMSVSGYITTFFPVVDHKSSSVRLGACVLSTEGGLFHADPRQWLIADPVVYQQAALYKEKPDSLVTLEVQWGSVVPDDAIGAKLVELVVTVLGGRSARVRVSFVVERHQADREMIAVTGHSYGLSFMAALMGCGPALYTGTGWTYDANGNLALEAADQLPMKVEAARGWKIPMYVPGYIRVSEEEDDVYDMSAFLGGYSMDGYFVIIPRRATDLMLYNYRLAYFLALAQNEGNVHGKETQAAIVQNKNKEWEEFTAFAASKGATDVNKFGQMLWEMFDAAAAHLKSVNREDEADSLMKQKPSEVQVLKWIDAKNAKAFTSLMDQCAIAMKKGVKVTSSKKNKAKSSIGTGFAGKTTWSSKFSQ